MGLQPVRESMRHSCPVPNVYVPEVNQSHENIPSIAITAPDFSGKSDCTSANYNSGLQLCSDGESTFPTVTAAGEGMPPSTTRADMVDIDASNTLTFQGGVSETLKRGFEQPQFSNPPLGVDRYRTFETPFTVTRRRSSEHAHESFAQRYADHSFKAQNVLNQSVPDQQDQQDQPVAVYHGPLSAPSPRYTQAASNAKAKSSLEIDAMLMQSNSYVANSSASSSSFQSPQIYQGSRAFSLMSPLVSPLVSPLMSPHDVSASCNFPVFKDRRLRESSMHMHSQSPDSMTFDTAPLDMCLNGSPRMSSGTSYTYTPVPVYDHNHSNGTVDMSAFRFNSPLLGPYSISGRTSFGEVAAQQYLPISPGCGPPPTLAEDVESLDLTPLGSPSISNGPMDFIQAWGTGTCAEALIHPEFWPERDSSSPSLLKAGPAASYYPKSIVTPSRVDGRPKTTAPPRPRDSNVHKEIDRKKQRKLRGDARNAPGRSASRFACDECPKKFTLKKDCNRHKEIHMGKKYRCDICHKHSARKDGLRRHMKNLHGVVLQGITAQPLLFAN